MSQKKSKSKKDSMNALANMGANMSAMLSGNSPLTESQSDNAEGAEIGAVEMPQSSVSVNPSVTDSTEEAPMQSAEGNGGVETPPPSVHEGGPKTGFPTPIEVNIDIDKTQGTAIYSSLLGLQNTLDNFQLDVKQDSLREVVYQAIKDAVEEHLTKIQLLFELGKILYNNSLKKMPFQCNCLYISGLI